MKLDLGVEQDHIESLTRASGANAIAELIWNSLDADASQISIDYTRTNLGGFSKISVKDDGHGLEYSKAQGVFGRLGGSEKKQATSSPEGRQYHGKEGKGRYKALALGDLVVFQSNFADNGQTNEFTITIDRNNLSYSEISDLKTLPKSETFRGFSVLIQNINQENASLAFDTASRKELEQKFASYWISYSNFTIFINGQKLEFDSLIKNSAEITLPVLVGELTYNFIVKVIEWNFDIKKKTYLCNAKGFHLEKLI